MPPTPVNHSCPAQLLCHQRFVGTLGTVVLVTIEVTVEFLPQGCLPVLVFSHQLPSVRSQSLGSPLFLGVLPCNPSNFDLFNLIYLIRVGLSSLCCTLALTGTGWDSCCLYLWLVPVSPLWHPVRRYKNSYIVIFLFVFCFFLVISPGT